LNGNAHGAASNGAAIPGATIDPPRKETRLLRILLYKLGQMQPGMPNLLVVHAGDEQARRIDLNRFMQAVKTRAEARDPAFYTTARYTSPAAFYKDFLHLSAVMLWTAEPQLWVNKQARPGLEEKVLKLLSTLMSQAHLR
jgi:hypothetical protein